MPEKTLSIKSAINTASITLPGTPYWWRTSESGAYTESTDTVYTLSSSHSYVEIRTRYAVTFDANGEKGNMADVTGISGAFLFVAAAFGKKKKIKAE